MGFVERNLDLGVPVTIRTKSSMDMSLYRDGNYSVLERAAFVGSMPFCKAITKMGWVVAQTGSDVLETKRMMETDYVGEFVPKHFGI